MIEEAWRAYRDGVASLPDAALEGPTDNAGWTAKDHIAHVTAWEMSITAGLQRQPQHEALGVTEEDMTLHIDPLNEKIRSAHAGISLDGALAASERSHRAFVEAIEALPDDAMQHPMGDYIPVSNPAAADTPVIVWILGDSAPHYREHLECIQQIVAP